MSGIDLGIHGMIDIRADVGGTQHACWVNITVRQDSGQEVEVSLYLSSRDRTKANKLAAAINACRDPALTHEEAEDEDAAREIHDEVPF